MINPVTMKGGFAVSVVLAGISLIHAASGWNHLLPEPQPSVVLASGLTHSAAPETVLLDASVPSSFVDSLRRADADRHFVVLDNVLGNPSPENQSVNAEDLATSMSQAREVVMQQAPKYVVVSDDAARSGLESSLRALLRTDARFKLLGTFPVSQGADSQTSSVYLYENIENTPAAVHYVPVRMVSANVAPDLARRK